ncbi:MAG: hypothetical protein HRU75_01640 [Planctomycetia bacterium]|nr:MAG: hypothetical protein HRU75_01640 [Planctomycetia bacterium]
MSEPRGVARPIDWHASFPILRMLTQLRSAAHLSRLLIGLVAVITLYAAGSLLDRLWPSSGRVLGTPAADSGQSEIARFATLSHSAFELWRVGRALEATRGDGGAGWSTLDGPFTAFIDYQGRCLAGAGRGLLAGRIGWSGGAFDSQPSLIGSVASGVSGVTWLLVTRPWFAAVFVVVLALVVGLLGVALSRHAAVQSARGLAPDLSESLAYAWERRGTIAALALGPAAVLAVGGALLMIPGYLLGALAAVPARGWTPLLLLLLGVALVALGILRGKQSPTPEGRGGRKVLAAGAVLAVAAGIGLIFNVSLLGFVGYALAGVALLPALLGGALLALVLIVVVPSGPLARAALAARGSDALDALQCGAAYLLQRPWKAAIYALISLIFATGALLVARGAVMVTLKMTHATVVARFDAARGVPTDSALRGEAGRASERVWSMPAWSELSWLPGEAIGGVIPHDAAPAGVRLMRWFAGLWVFLLAALVPAYGFSLYHTAAVQAYMLLRRDVDGDDFEDVFLPSEPDPLNFAPLEPADDPAGGPEAATTGIGESKGPPGGMSLPVMR